jgi:hypothetical protein
MIFGVGVAKMMNFVLGKQRLIICLHVSLLQTENGSFSDQTNIAVSFAKVF